MARIRKALIAAVGAAVPAGWAAFQQAAEDGTVDQADGAGIVSAVLVAAVAVGWTTWRVPNAGFVEVAPSGDQGPARRAL